APLGGDDGPRCSRTWTRSLSRSLAAQPPPRAWAGRRRSAGRSWVGMARPERSVMLRAVVEPGQVLAGKFRVERVLGQGGMGVVVAPYHLALGKRRALNILLAPRESTP